jgi:hypothetical protein
MKKHNGFALVLSLMFLLILTLLALILLLISGSYYASARNYFENENARIACEQSSKLMIDTHNLSSEIPRFFHDPDRWQGQNLVPFNWNEYEVKAALSAPWNTIGTNLLRIDVKKGRFNSSLDLNVSQIRLEDFALFLNSAQTLERASFIDGRVFSQDGLTLPMPTVRFRDFVHGGVTPEANASFRKKTDQIISYPDITSLHRLDDFFQAAQAEGVLINAQNPLFWNGVEYEMNLDRLTFQQEPMQRWRVTYSGIDLGIINQLQFWFDDAVRIRQNYSQSAFLHDSKTLHPIYISSISNVFLDSSLQPIETSTQRFPVCISAGSAIWISNRSPAFVRIHALLIAYGNALHDGVESSLIIEPGGTVIPSGEVESWKTEIGRSSFVIEPEKRSNFLSVIENGGKAVWFQESIALTSTMSIADDVDEVHFQSSKFRYSFLPSFPFVMILEGSQQWR